MFIDKGHPFVIVSGRHTGWTEPDCQHVMGPPLPPSDIAIASIRIADINTLDSYIAFELMRGLMLLLVTRWCYWQGNGLVIRRSRVRVLAGTIA